MDWRLYGARAGNQECIVYLDSYFKAGDRIVDRTSTSDFLKI